MHRYKVRSGAMATTGPIAPVALAGVTKTILQLATPSTRQCQIISWGYSLSVTPPGITTIELVQTDVAATMTTAHVAAGLQPLDPNAPASLMVLGTSATGFNASSENTATATRTFDQMQLGIAAGNNSLEYSYQFMPDERPIVAISKFLRLRATSTSATPTIDAWIVWDE